MKIKEFLSHVDFLSRLNLRGSAKFLFYMSRNIKRLKEEANEIKSTLQEINNKLYDKELIELDKKRISLLKKYSELDENGNIKYDSSGNAILKQDKVDKFKKAIDKFMKDNKELIDRRSKILEEQNNLLENEIDLEKLNLFKINIDLVPDNELSLKDMEVLFELGIIDEEQK